MLAKFDTINKLPASKVEDFEILDWKLIDFIGQYESVTKEQILKQFNNDNTYIIRLSRIRSIIGEKAEAFTNKDGSTGSKPTGKYYLIGPGKKLLQDYKARERRGWRNRMVAPITVSIIANIAIALMKWLGPILLNLAQQIFQQINQ